MFNQRNRGDSDYVRIFVLWQMLESKLVCELGKTADPSYIYKNFTSLYQRCSRNHDRISITPDFLQSLEHQICWIINFV